MIYQQVVHHFHPRLGSTTCASVMVFSRILNLKYRKIAKNVSIGCATWCRRDVRNLSYVTKSINFQRPRYWSDSFTMTPEALRMPYRKISFTTDDNIRLNGWFVPQSTREPRDVLSCVAVPTITTSRPCWAYAGFV